MAPGAPSSSRPMSTHRRKTKDTPVKPGHEQCQHSYKLMSIGKGPNPIAPWRTYIFKVHCVVTARWMKIRVPWAWFWEGSKEYGEPEVEMGTIANLPDADAPRHPIGPGPRMPNTMKLPGMQELELEDLQG